MTVADLWLQPDVLEAAKADFGQHVTAKAP
jgi:hypothetical protein